jgi:hypothetical protein
LDQGRRQINGVGLQQWGERQADRDKEREMERGRGQEEGKRFI